LNRLGENPYLLYEQQNTTTTTTKINSFFVILGLALIRLVENFDWEATK
jgi:hypothetical protein